jgi:hypothetical protein
MTSTQTQTITCDGHDATEERAGMCATIVASDLGDGWVRIGNSDVFLDPDTRNVFCAHHCDDATDLRLTAGDEFDIINYGK